MRYGRGGGEALSGEGGTRKVTMTAHARPLAQTRARARAHTHTQVIEMKALIIRKASAGIDAVREVRRETLAPA